MYVASARKVRAPVAGSGIRVTGGGDVRGTGVHRSARVTGGGAAIVGGSGDARGGVGSGGNGVTFAREMQAVAVSTRLATEEADMPRAVELTALINDVYALSDTGITLASPRCPVEAVEGFIKRGELIVAESVADLPAGAAARDAANYRQPYLGVIQVPPPIPYLAMRCVAWFCTGPSWSLTSMHLAAPRLTSLDLGGWFPSTGGGQGARGQRRLARRRQRWHWRR